MALKDWSFVTFVSFFTALGAFLSGYSIGSHNGLQNFAGYLEYLGLGNSSSNSSCTETTELEPVNRIILGAIISTSNLGGALGNLLAGKPADYFGRKVTLILSGVLVVAGTVTQSATVEGASWMPIVGRIIAGLGYGSFYLAGPVYIAEISPKHIRGSLTSFVGPTIALGIITGYVTNILLYDKPYGWRVSRLLASVFGCLYITGMTLVPRSPRWLMLKGRESEAREVLRKTSSKLGQDGIEAELEDIRQSLELEKGKNFLHELKLLVKWKNLKRLLLGGPLHIFAAACGTAIYFYSEPLFCSLGILPFVTALVIGGVTLCGTVFTTLFIDKVGRKPMLVGGGLLMSLLTGVAATLVLVFNLEEDNNDVIGYIVVCLVCLFMLVYSATWYVIPWVVTSEMFPLEGRGLAVAISTALNWTAGYSFTQAFPSILASIKTFGTIYMISLIDIVAALFFLFLIPETKGTSLEEMDALFEKPWLKRVGLSSCCRCVVREVDISSDREGSHKVVNAVNGVLTTGDNSVAGVSEENNMDSKKDWEDYWERYERETEPNRQTTV